MKKVLVIGGSYFTGRVFVRLAARTQEYELHVINRGNAPLKIDGITHYKCDRHNTTELAKMLPDTTWDAVIDFCAYEPDDIASLIHAIPGNIEQYIYISTCNVYEPSSPSPKSENAPLLTTDGDDPVVQYAYKKRCLEQEAAQACAEKKCTLTLLRPAFIYGPLNYAPRESFYFDCILNENLIPAPTDATGRFQFVYVKDVAKIIMGCIGNKETYGEAYNLSAPEQIDYSRFLEVLSKIHGNILPVQPFSVSQIYVQSIPLPFPLDTDELYTGNKITDTLNIDYVPFAEGLKETYDIYMDVHKK